MHSVSEKPLTPPNSPRLRMRAAPAAEKQIRQGHPWLYADSIREQNRKGRTGELGVVYDRQDRLLAIGLFDSESPIRLRILHVGRPETIDEAWWSIRLRHALEKRGGLFDDRTTGFRWINGESDGWPGLVLDRYGGVLVLKCYTGAWLSWLRLVVPILVDALEPKRIVLRLSRNIQSSPDRAGEWKDGQDIPLTFPAETESHVGNPSVEFLESGLRFEAQVVKGQKTGFFLDQRDNRRRVQTLAAGRNVLNAFSFSGGFSLHAASGGAASVTDLDISARALEAGDRNFTLNSDNARVKQCQREKVQADAFAWLRENARKKFGLIVLDPPSLARRESERKRAIQAYGRLAASAFDVLGKEGVLAAASCSAHVSPDEFFAAVHEAARKNGRKILELERTGHPPDHPAAIPEARYLKCVILKMR